MIPRATLACTRRGRGFWLPVHFYNYYIRRTTKVDRGFTVHRWYSYPFTPLHCKIPDARFELAASWSQTRRSTKLSQSGICSSLVAPRSGSRITGGFRESLTVQRLYRGLNPESQPWQGCGITSYPIEPCSAYSLNMLLKDIPAFFSLQGVNQVGRVRLELTMFLCGWFTVSCPRR